MIKLPSYSYSIATVLTPYGPFTWAAGKVKNEAGSTELTGGGTSCFLWGTICHFLLSEEGDVEATTRQSVVLVWIPSWNLD